MKTKLKTGTTVLEKKGRLEVQSEKCIEDPFYLEETSQSENFKNMNIPAELKYTKDHEWVRIEGDEAVIGITDFAQSELGDIVFVEIETEGESIESEEIFGSVEAVKTVSDLFMPLSGEVLSFNSELEDAPEVVNSDPYGEGWMIRVKISDASEVDALLSAEQYKDLIS